MNGRGSLFPTLKRRLRLRRSDRLARLLTERELAYLSRAIFRQRIDKPDDEPKLAAQLDPLVSVARMNAKQTVTKSADPPITEERPRDVDAPGATT